MSSLFSQLNFWHWWVLAVVFLILEVLAPATFFLWLAVSASVTGLLALVIPVMTWEYQVLLFAVLALVALMLTPRYFKRKRIVSADPTLNRRGAQYVGRTFTLAEPIVNGYGKIKVDDTTWRISGEEIPAGERVKVEGVDGTVLRVVRADT